MDLDARKPDTTPIIDPRAGDIEDDQSSTTRRTLISLAGSLLSEVSLSKLMLAWVLIVGLPGVLLGAAPLVVSVWVAKVSSRVAAVSMEILPAVVLAVLVAIGWFGGRRLFRLVEGSFWSLNALAVQPAYVLCREGVRHVSERGLSSAANDGMRASLRSASALVSGLLICAASMWVVSLAWPLSRWTASLAHVESLNWLASTIAANAIVIVASYLAGSALVWGVADATMRQPRDLRDFSLPQPHDRQWRVAHLSDIHVVGERYGFRLESGRSGPQGNERLRQILARLEDIHRKARLDIVLVTGDVTDAGRSSEWSEFFDALEAFPDIASILLILPGNHDVNVVDRANPARINLPTSPMKRLRQLRAISALSAIEGERVFIVDPSTGKLGQTLAKALEPRRIEMATFANEGSIRLSLPLADLWASVFPMIVPPATDDGLGIIMLNSNAESHFSFSNALGMISAEQAKAINLVAKQFPRAHWIVALHHHLVEYPTPPKALSERIGTALSNGTWFVRHLQRLADHVVVMHGHRHIDWIGVCGGVLIVSAPSPIMQDADGVVPYFYVHTLAAGPDGRVRLLQPERVELAGMNAS